MYVSKAQPSGAGHIAGDPIGADHRALDALSQPSLGGDADHDLAATRILDEIDQLHRHRYAGSRVRADKLLAQRHQPEGVGQN